MKPKKKDPKLDREFLRNWLIQVQPELPVIFRDIRRLGKGVTFHIAGFPNEIKGHLKTYGFTIWGLHKNHLFDMIADVDVEIAKSNEGYFCSGCNDGKYYKSAEDLWHQHQFPLLKDFLTNELLRAKWLGYFEGYRNGKKAGFSSCELIENEKQLARQIGQLTHLGDELKPVNGDGKTNRELKGASEVRVERLIPLQGKLKQMP